MVALRLKPGLKGSKDQVIKAGRQRISRCFQRELVLLCGNFQVVGTFKHQAKAKAKAKSVTDNLSPSSLRGHVETEPVGEEGTDLRR